MSTSADDRGVSAGQRPRERRLTRVLVWILAVLLMFAAVVYQRRTGPTHPYRGSFVAGGTDHRYKLVRSGSSSEDARVVLPRPGPEVTAELYYKRFSTDDPFTSLPLEPEGQELVAELPRQPAAGKLEYYLIVHTGEGSVRIPEESGDDIVIRFKNDVPGFILWPHVVMMFFSVLIGMRAGLAALLGLTDARPLAWTALIGMTAGGMILGPTVQKYAFGAFWTGFPFGYDLTDNKMLIMWLAWLLACTTVGLRAAGKEIVGRVVVILAALVMTVVYLIPHSMHGSQLDYSKVDSGVDPSRAIGTSDR